MLLLALVTPDLLSTSTKNNKIDNLIRTKSMIFPLENDDL